MLKRLILAIFFLLNISYISYGQEQNTNNKTSNSFWDRLAWVNPQTNDVHEMNLIGGHSFASTQGFWGKIPKATLSIYTLRYNRRLATYNEKHLLEYVTEVNLAANYTLSDTEGYRAGEYSGFGITPLGFQFNFNFKKRIQPFLKSSTGFMYFKKPFPDNRGVPFNFTLELGGGLEIILIKNASLTLGYKYHHMSNGQFGQINPGVDSNVFYVGFTIF